ncbi:MAG: efflux RND transporter periplasmic adaptor subunit, partial [Planctomycetota bacterium]
EREAQRDVKAAQLKSAEAALVQAQLDLDYTTIASPVSGRASRELVDAGNLVGAGENTLLTTIVVDDRLYAYFNVSERELLKYLQQRSTEEQRTRTRAIDVQLQLTDGSIYEHAGTVNYADNRVDPRTGTLQVRATVPNPTGRLFPGLFCRVLVPVQLGESLLVPELSIQRDIVGPYVLVVDNENIVQRIDVELGPIIGRRRVVTSGLQGDERIVVNGLQRARPGAAVDPETAAPSPEPSDPAAGETPAEAGAGGSDA